MTLLRASGNNLRKYGARALTEDTEQIRKDNCAG
jgi:hypothetical protein